MKSYNYALHKKEINAIILRCLPSRDIIQKIPNLICMQSRGHNLSSSMSRGTDLEVR